MMMLLRPAGAGPERGGVRAGSELHPPPPIRGEEARRNLAEWRPSASPAGSRVSRRGMASTRAPLPAPPALGVFHGSASYLVACFPSSPPSALRFDFYFRAAGRNQTRFSPRSGPLYLPALWFLRRREGWSRTLASTFLSRKKES